MKNCKYTTPFGEPSDILFNKLLEITNNNESEAVELHSYFITDQFLNSFGNYLNVTEDNYFEFQDRIDDLGEPLLKYDSTLKKHYYLDKFNEPIYFPFRKEGIYSYFDSNDVNEFAKTLALKFYQKNYTLNPDTFEFDEINNDNLNIFVRDFVQNKIIELNSSDDFEHQIISVALRESFDYVNQWVDEVVKFYDSFSIELNLTDLEINEERDSLEESPRGELIAKNSYEKDAKTNINDNIKLFLSLIPSNKVNKFNEVEFFDFNLIYQTLNRTLSNKAVSNNAETEFDVYLNEIQKLSNVDSNYINLYEKLANASDIFKNQFVSAFRLSKNNFLSSVYQKSKEGVSQKTLNVSEVNTLQSSILKKWEVQKEDLKLNNTKIKEIINSLSALKTELIKNKKNINSILELQDYIINYQQLSNKFGLDFTNKGMSLFLNSLKTEESSLEEKVNNLIDLVKNSERSLNSTLANNSLNIFKDQEVFRNLANAESFFIPEMSNASITTTEGTKWVYSVPSFLSSQIDRWKANPELLQTLYESSEYTKGSKWMEYLLALNEGLSKEEQLKVSKERINKIELFLFNSLETENGLPVDGKNISFFDRYVDYLNKSLAFNKEGGKSYQKTALAADKNREYNFNFGDVIDVFNFNTNIKRENNSFYIPEKILNVFYDYFKSEYNRMIYEWEYVNNNPNYKLKPNYHLGNKNAFKSQLFPSLSISFNSNGEVVLPNINFPLYDNQGKPIVKDLDLVKDQVLPLIEKSLKSGINKSYTKFFENGVFNINEKGDFENIGLDESVYKVYLNKFKSKEEAILNIAADLYVNGLVSQIEYSKMFTGDVAYYKDMVDYKKRVPATYTDGLYLNVSQEEENFKIAVINSIEISIPYLNKLEELIGKEKAKAYKETNAADAQAWITAERWKFIMEKSGKWNSKKAKLYQKMISDEKVTFTKKELKLLGQPVKGVYFSNTQNDPTYLKYSQSVLWPRLIKGTDLEKINDKMLSQGISELVTKDGIKVGYTVPNKIHVGSNLIEDFDNFTFTTLDLLNSYYKIQQDLPIKGFKETDLGSQIQKNIFQGLIYFPNEVFYFNNEEKSSLEMIDIINNILSKKSNIGLNKVLKKLKVNPNTFKIENEDAMFKTILDQLKTRKDVTRNLTNSLQAKLSPYGIPGELTTFLNVFFSFVKNNTVKIKTNGGSFIQMSDFGIGRNDLNKQGIIFTPWFDKEKLPTPELYIDEKTNRKTVKPGGIFLTGSMIAKYIPDYRQKSSEELFGVLNQETGKYEGGLIDERILRNIIGYRIPNQALASNDSLEVMGILPEEVGDTIIPYTGITVKTGSDFDIDKMYLMIPSFKTIYKEQNFKIARDYIKQENITFEDIQDELIDNGYNLNNLSRENIFTLFIEDILFNSYGTNSENAIHQHFQKKYDINGVKKLEYIEDPNSEEGLNNQLIEAYKAVLSNVAVAPNLMTPLDGAYIKDDINLLNESTAKEDLEDFDVLTDLEIKTGFQQGKAGLGQAVNALVEMARGGMAKFELKNVNLTQGHLTKDNTIPLDLEFSNELLPSEKLFYEKQYKEFWEKENPNKEYTPLDWDELGKIPLFNSMMYYINGFVDVAKDDYVIKGNWTTVTNNVGILMIRSGVHPFFVNAFLSQPILKQYVKFVSNQESKILDNTFNLDEQFKINYIINSVDNRNIYINGINKTKKLLANLAFSDAPNTAFSKLVENKSEDRAQELFQNWVEEMEKNIASLYKLSIPEIKTSIEFNETVNEFKNLFIENFKKQDNTFDDLTLVDLHQEIKNPTLQNQLSIFYKFLYLVKSSKVLTKSIKASKVDVEGSGKDINSLFIFKNIYDEMLNQPIDSDNPVLLNFYKKLENTFGGTMYENSINTAFKIISNNPKFFLTAQPKVLNTFNYISKMIYGTNLSSEVLGNKLEKSFISYVYSNFNPLKINSKEEQDDLIINLPKTFLNKKLNSDNFLLKNLNVEVGDDGVKYITLKNLKRPVSEKNRLVDAWYDLLESDKDFAEKLIKYSYLNSGFNKTIKSFYEYIPYQWFNQNGFNSYLKNLYNNTDDSQFDSSFVDQFFKNNFNDPYIVRKISKKKPVKSYTTSGFLLPLDSKDNRAPYLVYKEFFQEGRSYRLYFKLEGLDKNSNLVYTRTSVLGFKDTKGNRIVEWDYNNSNFKSKLYKNMEEEKAFNLKEIQNYKNLVVTDIETFLDLKQDSFETLTLEGLWNDFRQKIIEKYPNTTFEDFSSMYQINNNLEEFREFLIKCYS